MYVPVSSQRKSCLVGKGEHNLMRLFLPLYFQNIRKICFGNVEDHTSCRDSSCYEHFRGSQPTGSGAADEFFGAIRGDPYVGTHVDYSPQAISAAVKSLTF